MVIEEILWKMPWLGTCTGAAQTDLQTLSPILVDPFNFWLLYFGMTHTKYPNISIICSKWRRYSCVFVNAAWPLQCCNYCGDFARKNRRYRWPDKWAHNHLTLWSPGIKYFVCNVSVFIYFAFKSSHIKRQNPNF